MINGAHAIIYSNDADADRIFFKDVLGLHSVDAGGGWLIFGLPPAEVAVHPDEPGKPGHELYLMCADIEATLRDLEGKGARVEPQLYDERWGRLAFLQLPGGARLGIYQPRHPRPPKWSIRQSSSSEAGTQRASSTSTRPKPESKGSKRRTG
jgi:catechol 2,3-dioxygenase-like lactoylglutathione lyase family enzyme